MEERKTPWWFKLLVVVMMVPVLGFPTLLSAADVAETPVTLLGWLYPACVLLSGVCAWICYRQRPELAWILLVLMALSNA